MQRGSPVLLSCRRYAETVGCFNNNPSNAVIDTSIAMFYFVCIIGTYIILTLFPSPHVDALAGVSIANLMIQLFASVSDFEAFRGFLERSP